MAETPVLTSGTVAMIVIVPILLILTGVAFVFLRRLSTRLKTEAEKSRYSRESKLDDAHLARGASFLAVPVALVIGALTWWGMYPWKAEYHHWTPISGTVETVDSRLVSTGENAMEDKYVVKLNGSDQQYGVLDTRAAGLKPGDHLSITCVRIWQYSGTDGFDCNFVSLQRKQ